MANNMRFCLSFRRKKQYVKTYVKNCSYYIINMVTIQLQSNKARDSFNVTLLSDTHTLKIQYEYTQTQCDEGARDAIDISYMGIAFYILF